MDQLIGLVTLMTGVGVFFFVALRVIIADTPVDWQSAAAAKSASADAGMNSATLSTTLTSMDSGGSVSSTSCGHDSGFSTHC